MRQLKFTELCALFGPYINLAGAINVNQGELICRQMFTEMCKPPAKPFDPAMYESDPEGMELMSRSGEAVRWVAKPVGGGRGVYTLIASNKMRMFNWENGQLDRGEEGPHDLMMRIIDKPVTSNPVVEPVVAAPAVVAVQPAPPEAVLGDLQVVLDVANPRTRAARFNAQAAAQTVARAREAVGGVVRRGILVDPARIDPAVVNAEAALDAIREARGEVAARFVEIGVPDQVANLNNNF